MRKRFIFFFFASTFIAASANYIYPQSATDSDTIVINSVNIKTSSGDVPAESIDFKDAHKWAKTFRLSLAPDAPPVTDNKAFRLTQYQTVIPVSCYKKDSLYKVYIDFFRYNNANVPFNSMLKIFIRDIYGNKRQIGTANIRSMTDAKRFELSIPFDMSYPGKFDLIIHEYSEKTGCWGVWDIIISSKKISEIEFLPADSAEKMKEIEPKIFK